MALVKIKQNLQYDTPTAYTDVYSVIINTIAIQHIYIYKHYNQE